MAVAAKKPKKPTDEAQALYQAIVSLKSADEAASFLADLCTPGEVRALAERWHVARLLNEGELSYREINAETGVSTATVVRVARFLNEEDYGGYRLALGRLRKKKS
ncbi:MAG: TrpR like protein, YerC/YecD [Marinicaulis sp.]|nr:TrpR like protein, YerC/YecD [Marinicaulis sp.]